MTGYKTDSFFQRPAYAGRFFRLRAGVTVQSA